MKQRSLFIRIGALLLSVVLLGGCAEGPRPVESADPAAHSAADSAASQTGSSDSAATSEEQPPVEGATRVELLGQSFWLGPDGRIIEPDWRLDIDSMSFADFGNSFQAVYPVKVDTYKLMEGTEYEITVHHIVSENEGPVIYLVAGVHGDENAGWYAGNLLRKATVSCGELYVLSPANATGAATHTRYIQANIDLNRSFPGSESGNIGQQVAHAIYSDIERVRPAFVFDLHEAIVYRDDRDFLGSNLIASPGEGIDISMLVEMQFATEFGELCYEPFSLNGPGPVGSINNTVSGNLKILTLTVETFRGFPIEHRVDEQLQIVEYVLKYYGMR